MDKKPPETLAKDTAIYGKLPEDKKKLIEAYGLGVLHGVEIAQEMLGNKKPA